MRILLFIDSFATGGAQRQLFELGRLLRSQEHVVTLLTYHDHVHGSRLEAKYNELGVGLIKIRERRKARRFRLLRQAILRESPEVVIAFLPSPSLVAEVAKATGGHFALIVSERDCQIGFLARLSSIPRYLGHLLADTVVCNSVSQARVIEKIAPWLKSRTVHIANTIDETQFFPSKDLLPGGGVTPIRIVGIGRYEEKKDPRLLIEGLRLLRVQYPEIKFQLDWYGDNFFRNGRPTKRSGYFVRLEEEIRAWGLADVVKLNGLVRTDAELYHRYSLFFLSSLYEGFPNVVGEAMICGLPVIATRVGDIEDLIIEGRTGYILKDRSAESVCQSIANFHRLSESDRLEMSRATVNHARRLLNQDRFLSEFNEVLRRSISHQAGAI